MSGVLGKAWDSASTGGQGKLGNCTMATYSPARTNKSAVMGTGTAGEFRPGGEAKERQGADFLSSTQLSRQVGVFMFEGGGGLTLSPFVAGGRVGAQGRPSFITGLYQDEVRRLTEIAKQGGLTFCHSAEGDVDIQERGSGICCA